MAIAVYGHSYEILGTRSIARRCSGLCRSLDFKCIPLRTERASTALTRGLSARLQTIFSAADSKPLSRTRRSQRIQVSSNTGRRARMESPSYTSCISIHIWICLTARLSASISEDTICRGDSERTRGSDSCDSGLSLSTYISLGSGMGVSDEVVHKAAEGGANLSEYVAQRELSGQQCDGELLWTLKSKRFTMGASTIATRSSKRRLRNISSTTTSTGIKESLGWLSPAQYRRKHLAA